MTSTLLNIQLPIQVWLTLLLELSAEPIHSSTMTQQSKNASNFLLESGRLPYHPSNTRLLKRLTKMRCLLDLELLRRACSIPQDIARVMLQKPDSFSLLKPSWTSTKPDLSSQLTSISLLEAKMSNA